MKITILCSSETHPVNNMLHKWIARHQENHEIILARSKGELIGGDLLFLISCNEIISSQDRDKFTKSLIIHASDLPKGRGWSPHIWELLNGEEGLTVSLIEAEDKVDSGSIWKKEYVFVPKHALYDEINEILFKAESDLMDFAVDSFLAIKPQPQDAYIEPSYYRRRTQEDSEIDPHKSISSQFDLLRVCDKERYPAYFSLNNYRYKIIIEKIDDE